MFHPLFVAVENLYIEAWHWLDGGPRLLIECVQLLGEVGNNWPPGLRLPVVVVEERVGEVRGYPVVGGNVAALARHVKHLQLLRVVLLHLQSFGVLAADRADRAGKTEKALHVSILNHFPVRPRVRRAHRLALENYSGGPLQ